MTVADHLDALINHCGRTLFHTVLVNNRPPSENSLRKYEQQNSRAVNLNRGRLLDLDVRIVERDLLAEDGAIRHDSDKLAEAVWELSTSGSKAAGARGVGRE